MSSGKAFIGKPAPDFTATAVMPDGQFKDIKLSDYRGKFMCLSNYINAVWPYVGVRGHLICFGFKVIVKT